MLESRAEATRLLVELGIRIEFIGAQPIGLVVCGGTALNILKIVDRPTKDIDVVALAREVQGKVSLCRAELPDDFRKCCADVGSANGLGPVWLNVGAGELLARGLPEGIEDRLERRDFGRRLRLYLVSRIDLVFLKLLAAVSGSAREAQHVQDLLALKATSEEIERARDWVLDQEPDHDRCEQMKESLRRLLSDMGHSDLAYGW